MVTPNINPNQKKERVPRMPNRQYAYFRDDQITCLMTHDPTIVPDKLTEDHLRNWKNAVEEFLKRFPSAPRIVWPPRYFSFRALQDDESSQRVRGFTEPFSIIVCEMENVPQDPSEFLDFVLALSQPMNPDIPKEQDLGLVGRKLAGLTMQNISPNWLASGASQAGGTGGPGGWPSPFRGNPSRAPYQFRDLISKLRDAGFGGEGEGVDIAILDTAPGPHDLVAAYKECKTWHPLIRTLLGPNGKLKLYPATYEENLWMGSTSLNEHDYKMTDHGLFAAGIVHSIVPKATIHLIEVLNPFAVSDLAMLAGGLNKVFDLIYESVQPTDSKPPLVINCSWMLEPPLVPEHRRDPDSQFEEKVMRMAIEYRDHAFSLKSICEHFDTIGRQVVAAAGNDWRANGADRGAAPVTRYPAAFLGTFGVGALPKDSRADSKGKYKASSYSNLADIPDNVKRIMTLGGEEGEEKGVLGLYLGEFPGCEPKSNCTKWAWWSGTSFATPILTGAMAAVLSSIPESGKPKISRTQDAIQALYDHKIIETEKTYAKEDVMAVNQDYQPA